MIYSPKFDFVAIRTPKSGSTTMAIYLLDSGLLNVHRDNISMPNLHKRFISETGDLVLDSLDPSQKIIEYENPYAYTPFHTTFTPFNLALLRKRRERIEQSSSNPVMSLMHSSHIRYSAAVGSKEIPENTPCYSTIRNPLDRWLSLLNITYSKREIETEGVNEISLRLLETMTEFRKKCNGELPKVEQFPQGVTSFLYYPQHFYFSDTATLWPLEKLHECMLEFIIPKGGRVRGNWNVRQHKSRDRNVVLSIETQRKVNEYFEKDLELWEASLL